MSDFDDPVSLFTTRFGDGLKPDVVAVPGRVNLIGEHIDYHNLPVLPMAIGRKIRVAFRARTDRVIRACSNSFGEREYEWTTQLMPSASGDWVNYVKAAAQAVEGRWKLKFGIDATVVSDLPPAAGLSSSSALLTGLTLALLRANGVQATFEELMDVLPEGEYFVGTRGGGMDHAAVLAGRRGCAILVNFAPLSVSSVPVPEGWVFLIAHSLTTAEKSGDVRSKYNARRTAGSNALHGLGFHSFGQALERYSVEELSELAAGHLADDEQRCFLHVVTEAHRVTAAVAAMRAGDAESFGRLLYESHASLRDWLRVSSPALDSLVEAARAAGALGARLTGGGFGGCAVVLCRAAERERVAAGIVERFYAGRAGFDPNVHLIAAEPSAGALSEE
jgi:galactokinase